MVYKYNRPQGCVRRCVGVEVCVRVCGVLGLGVWDIKIPLILKVLEVIFLPWANKKMWIARKKKNNNNFQDFKN
jgi:hypothetical protein